MKKIAVLSLLSILLLAACRDSIRDKDTTVDFTTEQTLAQHVLNDIFFNYHHFALEDSVIGSNSDTIFDNVKDGCLKAVYYSSQNGVNAVVFDYENNTSACSDTKIRSGRMVAKVTGRYTDSLSTTTITFSNFKTDNILIEGTMVIKNRGIQADGKKKLEVDFTDVILSSDTLRILVDFDEVFYQTAGITTDSDTDDSFEITGSSNGIITNGNSFNAVITEILTATSSCEWITRGKITITPKNLVPRKIDYGSGSCDKSISLTKNDVTQTIELPY